ncbi:MAG: nitroreductase family deazaflavin-dependent oxidoreductase [Solirubrobacteraceae bacterium]|nr:nitroreductase family deazaflavin-dependent oxidoreductase [Solirubrobacteraceae bacterium]
MGKLPEPGTPLWTAWLRFTDLHTSLIRASRGRVGGRWGKAGILVLHHVGARTGTLRTAPLLFGRDGESIVIVASQGGSDRNPAWLANLRANPDTVVELPGERTPRPVRARIAEGEERERLWRMMVGLYRSYDSYQRMTTRRIPVVVLEPR